MGHFVAECVLVSRWTVGMLELEIIVVFGGGSRLVYFC